MGVLNRVIVGKTEFVDSEYFDEFVLKSKGNIYREGTTGEYVVVLTTDIIEIEEEYQRIKALRSLMKNEGEEKLYRFMFDGIVMVKFVDRMNITKISLKIKKLPSNWSDSVALSLGYSNNVFAYRNFGGLKGVFRFIDSFVKKMDIDLSEEVKKA